MGFATGISSTSGGGNSWARQKIEWVYGDNNNGILIDNSHDTPYISHCHFWPFASISPTATLSNHVRTGNGFTVTNSDLISLSHNFCFSYQIGYDIRQDGGAFLPRLSGRRYFQWLRKVSSPDTGLEGTRAMGCVAFANAGTTTSTGYRVNVPAQDYMEFTACYANSCATAYDIVSGDCKISGGTVDHCTIAISVTSRSAASSVFLRRFSAPSRSPMPWFNNAGGGGGIYIDPDCDFS